MKMKNPKVNKLQKQNKIQKELRLKISKLSI